ncbi:class I SAM-dependent methyltransferase [Helicobacter pullorum]|uniref:class I SAM-dependent methyltransferase n=1 Tax=Helicobacter pullorum TaxID=35818 RepID=UPI00242A8960|nr:class I SAM-dependent methyltransferase [Helicobacter pullorum]
MPPPPLTHSNFKILDLGAGEGFFTKMIYEILESKNLNPKDHIVAIDINNEKYKFDNIPCEFGDFNQGLEYNNQSFYCVISMEVIEHLENPFAYIKEMSRILENQGILILTTPNISNLTSRIQYFFHGTYPLFNYLPIKDEFLKGCNQHINPLSLIYLAFILKYNGFKLEVTTDKFKKGSIFCYYLLKPLFYFLKKSMQKKLQKNENVIYWDNLDIIPLMYSKEILCGRTLIIKATKQS